ARRTLLLHVRQPEHRGQPPPRPRHADTLPIPIPTHHGEPPHARPTPRTAHHPTGDDHHP
ncbi:hypothetical protein STRTUCAR8_04699, partial [Streptomyces turgidiscabies Car8]